MAPAKRLRPLIPAAAFFLAALVPLSGCTSPRQWVQNGFKVGPNYCRPPAPVAPQWIDVAQPAVNGPARVLANRADLSHWWTVFNDPALDGLIRMAYEQNLPLREAAFRVLQSRAELAIATGGLFPQSQTANGSYRRIGIDHSFSSQWNFNFNLAWELDVWGRLRRAIASANDTLDASIEDYDAVLVTLLGDVASNYIRIRTDQVRIKLLEENVDFQERVVLKYLESRAAVGKANVVDLKQALANVAQTKAAIPPVQQDLRQTSNALSILLGMPPEKLWETETLRTTKNRWDIEIRSDPKTAEVQILPATGDILPVEVAAGIPADLLRRRPDVRRAERTAAAQAEQIGIAEAQLYPAFSINGTLGYQASRLSQLFSSNALNASVGPSFQWNILNYGRIINNVRLQDAKFQELVATYQNTVLQADEEVENGLVAFLESWQHEQLLKDSVTRTGEARNWALKLYLEGPAPGAVQGVVGTSSFNQYSVLEQNFIQQQDQWAQSRGEIAQGLIQVYRGLGGGWEIRCQPAPVAMPPGPEFAPPPAEELVPPPIPQPKGEGAPKANQSLRRSPFPLGTRPMLKPETVPAEEPTEAPAIARQDEPEAMEDARE